MDLSCSEWSKAVAEFFNGAKKVAKFCSGIN